MPEIVVLVGQQIRESLRLLGSQTVRIAALTSLLMTVISLAIAPNVDPGVWSWIGLLLIGGLGMISLLAAIHGNEPGGSPDTRQYRRTAAVTLVTIAIVLNLFFSMLSTCIFALGMFALYRQSTRLRPGTFPWMTCATIVTLIPWWIWTALDDFDAGLLLLIPLAALAYLAGHHIHQAYQDVRDPADPLSPRAHRLGAWIALLLAGILIALAGLLGESVAAWVALGGIVMAVAVALEAGIARPDAQPGRHADTIVNIAFLVSAVCWLTSIK